MFLDYNARCSALGAGPFVVRVLNYPRMGLYGGIDHFYSFDLKQMFSLLAVILIFYFLSRPFILGAFMARGTYFDPLVESLINT